jgi:hypothetical protein
MTGLHSFRSTGHKVLKMILRKLNLWRSPCLALLYKENLQTRDELSLLAVDSALLIPNNHEIYGTQQMLF